MAELEICLAKLEERVGAIQDDMKELKIVEVPVYVETSPAQGNSS